MPILIALMWKYASLSSETLKQIRQNKEKVPVLDPMQEAILPEVIALLIVSFVSYVVIDIFTPANSVKYVAVGQLGLIFFLSPFCLWYWLGLRHVKRFLNRN